MPNPTPEPTPTATPPQQPKTKYIPPPTPAGRGAKTLEISYRNQKQGYTMNAPTIGVPKRGFWEDPQRIATYRNLLRSRPPDYQTPPGVDRQAIEQAYQYMRFRNNDAPWQEWKMLPENDPGTSWLREMQAPPPPFTLPADRKDAASEQPQTPPGVVDYSQLPNWEQTAMLLFPQGNLANRPAASKLGAAAWQSALSALGPAAIATALGGPVAGGIVGLGALGLGTYSAYTGTPIPIFSDAMELMDILALTAKRSYGLYAQAREAGLEEVLANLPAAWDAGLLAYTTAESDFINTIGPTISAGWDVAAQLGISRDGGGGWNGPASATEVWKFHQGYIDPQGIAPNQYGQIVRGGAALEEARKRILEGEPIEAIIADFDERYGATGILNDFLWETIADPANLLPFLEGKVGAKVADLTGHQRLAQHFRDMTGNPLIDLTPFPLQGIISAVTGKHGSAGLLETLSSYKYAVVQRGHWPGGSEIPDASALSDFDKKIGGLTPTGKIAEMEPTTAKPGLIGWIKTLTSLTPASQAHALISIYQDNLNNLFTLTNMEPARMNQILEQAAGVKPTEAGAAGEAILKAPTTATVQDGYRHAIQDGTPEKMLAQWEATGDQRLVLNRLAQALQEENPGRIIEQLNADPEALARRIAGIPDLPDNLRQLATPEALKAFFKAYEGENPTPWSPEQYRAQLFLNVSDKMDQWIAQRYNLKPDHAVFRMSQALKGMQSLLLLGLNPTYFINNAVNNVVTRSAVGVFGFMTPKQIDGFMERFGLVPHRLREGLGPAGDPTTTSTPVNAALHAGDWIDKAQTVIDAANQKMGLFSRFSAANERYESSQAYTIGILRFMNKQWRRGKGLRKMSPALEAMLDQQAPGIKEAIYAAVESGLNIREVEEKLLGDYIQPQINAVVQEAAAKILPNNPDIINMMVAETGVMTALEQELANAKTPEEVDAAFARVGNRLEEFVNEASQREIVHRAEEVRNMVAQEGFPAALSLFVDLQVRIATRWLRHFADLQNLFASRADMNGDQFDTAIRSQMEKDSQSWKRVNDFEEQTMAGILQAIGLDNPASREFSALLVEAHANTRRFFDGWDETRPDGTTIHHDGRNEKLKKFYAANRKRKRGETGEQAQQRFAEGWRRLQAELSLDYQRMASEENRLQQAMNERFSQAFAQLTGRPADEAMAWREQVQVIRMQMQEEMTNFRAQVETAGLNAEQRHAAWSEFLQRYNRMIAELKQTEIEGAYNLSHQPGAGASAVEQINQAVPPAQPAAPPPPDEAAINAALSETGETAPNPDVLTRLQMAAEANVTNKDGSPIHPNHLVNVINEGLRKMAKDGETPRQYKPEDLASIPLADMEAGLRYNKIKHGHENAQSAAELAMVVDDILKNADAHAREAELRAAGLMSRRHLREKWRAFDVEEEAIDTAMTLLDHHAKRMARQNGLPVDDTTTDRWIATHIKDIIDESNRGLQQADPPWYYSQLQRSLETMPNRMTPEALEGFLKGKAKADELKWTAFDSWLLEKKAKGEQVTKQEAVAFVRAHRIRIKEKVLGGKGTLESMPGWRENETILRQAGYNLVTDPEAGIGFEMDGEIRVAGDDLGDPVADEAAMAIAQSYYAFTRNAAFAVDERFMEMADDLKEYGILANTAMDAPDLFEEGGGWEGYRINFMPTDEAIAEYGDMDSFSEVEGVDANYYNIQRLPKEARRLIRHMSEFAQDYKIGEPTKFFQYTDQQGANYRELLLEWDRPEDELLAWDYYENELRPKATAAQAWEDLQDHQREAYINDVRNKKNLPNWVYRPHWGNEVNVLAHVRFSERTNKAGERILYIEEIQSDLHEQGRERGYQARPEDLQAWKAELRQLEDERDVIWTQRQEELRAMGIEAQAWVEEQTGQEYLPSYALRQARQMSEEWEARFQEYRQRAAPLDPIDQKLAEIQSRINLGQDRSLPPQAPFKNSWPELVMKRVIRWAAENDFDRIAVASGKENADRYNLSTYYSQIKFTKMEDGSFYIHPTDKDGKRGYESHASSYAELKDSVGEEIARKVRESPDDVVTLHGEELAVGGQGMRKFYDEMLPSITGKYIKKWGSSIEPTDYGAAPAPVSDITPGSYHVEEHPDEPGMWIVYDFDNDPIDYFTTREAAEDYAKQLTWVNSPDLFAMYDGSEEDIANGMLPYMWNMTREDLEGFETEGQIIKPMNELFPKPPETPQRLSFKVTPEMKKAAMEGQSLFQRDPGSRPQQQEIRPLPGITPTNTQEFKKWFGKSQMLELDDSTPLVLYHATTAEFDAFKLNEWGEIGIHFGTLEQAQDRIVARQRYLDSDKGKKARLIPVYLRLENPIMIDFDPGDWKVESWKNIAKRRGSYDLWTRMDDAEFRAKQWYTAELQRLGKNPPEEAVRELQRQHNRIIQQAVTNILQEAGFDGVAYPNEIEGKKGDYSYAVFDPSQIKSVYNAGTWSRETKNIYKQRGIPVEQQVQRVHDMQWIDAASIESVFKGGTPKHLRGVVDFILGQRKKYLDGKLTARDVAKAYLLTVSSIGSSEKPFAPVLRHFQENGIHFIRDEFPIELEYYAYQDPTSGEWMVRPEEITAAWLMTDEGRAALDAIERGEITEGWQRFIKARVEAFGRFGGGEESASGAWFLKPGGAKKNLADIREITRRINAAKGDPAEMTTIVQDLAGIAGGKSGFIKHLLGFGDETTIDAQEINFWTGHIDNEADADFIRSRGKHKSRQITDAIKQRIQQSFYELRKQGIGADIPEEAFVHVMHHWLWDAQKKTETTHQGMYRAMRMAQGGRIEPGTRAAVDFVSDGRAIIAGINAPNVSSMVHELAHIFRRELPESDLNTIARWGGLTDASQLRLLESRFLAGELKEGDPDHQRYVDAEEKFARGWERYVAEGDAPTPELRSVFQKFSDWLRDIYQSLKKTMGRVVGFEQQPQFAEYGGANIHEIVGGVKIRDILDRQLVDAAERPMSFEELVANQVKRLKDYGQKYRNYTPKELADTAKELVTRSLLKDSADETAASNLAERMVDEEPATTLMGEAIHPTAYWDALQEAKKNPKTAPWYQEPFEATKAAESQLTTQERTILNRPVSTLPTPVRSAIQTAARVLLNDLQHGGGVRAHNEAGDVVAGREGAAWYLALYDSQGKPAGFKRSLRTALEKIVAGTEDINRPATGLAKQEILGQLAGEIAYDSGFVPDAAVLWYLGRKEKLFQTFQDQFETATQEWLEDKFGTDADQAMNEYLLWTVEGEPDVVETEPAPTIAQRITADEQQLLQQENNFNAGDPIPLDETTQMELTAAEPIERPESVNTTIGLIKAKLKKKQHPYADELIDWYMTPHHTATIPDSDLPPAQAAATERAVWENKDALESWARQQEKPTPVKAAKPGEGLQAQRVHAHTHGDTPIAAIVYLDGQPTAYLPTAEAAQPFMEDGSRLLGLDPADPKSWIIYRDGEIGKINPENPGRPFYQAPEPPPAPRITNEVFRKKTGEMTQAEREYALTHDEMTGLMNRRAYNERERLPIQVVMDVEGLKYVNDNYGHEAGDQVIMALANSIKQVTEEGYRGSDRGDEFLMQFKTEAEAVAAVSRVEEILALQEITTGEHEKYAGLGVSAGIGKTLHDADMALNTNKAQAIQEGRRANRGEKPTRLHQVTEQPAAAPPAGQGELPGIPPAPEFTLEQQQAAPEEFNPQEQPPQQSLFDRQEYLRQIEARRAEGEEIDPDNPQPGRLFQRDDETSMSDAELENWAIVLNHLNLEHADVEMIRRAMRSLPNDRTRERFYRELQKQNPEAAEMISPTGQLRTGEYWTKRARELYRVSEIIDGSGWILPDGTILRFERQPEKGFFITHYDSSQDITNDRATFAEFVNATKMVRIDRHLGHIQIEAFRRLTDAQIDTILRNATEGVDFTVDISQATDMGSRSLDFVEDIFGYEKERLRQVLESAHRQRLQQDDTLPDHPWIRRLKDRYHVTEHMEEGSSYLTRAGEWVLMTGPDDHDAGATVASEINGMDAANFMRKTRAIRVGRVTVEPGEVVIYAQLMQRPTIAQLQALLDETGNRYITLMVGEDDGYTESFHAKNDRRQIDNYLDEVFADRRLYDRFNPTLSLSAIADFPSPLSGYVGNKRSMLQAGHYNEILTRDRAASYNRILEAFGGSGLLGNAFQTRAQRPRVLNELDDLVVNFHRQAKANNTELLDAIRAERDTVMEIFNEYPEGGGEAYGAIQDYWRDMQYRLGNGTDIEKGAMVAIMNSGSLSVMGGGQKLISGASTTEGSYVWRISADSFDSVIDQIQKHGELLKDVEIRQQDAREILAEATPHELVLLDPPYVQRGADDTRVTGYREGADLTTVQGALDFIDRDMRQAAEKGTPMVYTNNAHPAIVAALEEIGFHIRLVEVRSQNRGGQAAMRMEVVAWNDPVGPADASWRSADTTKRRQVIGNGRMEYLQYKARARAAQREANPTPAGEGAVGAVPLGGTPMPEPAGQTLDEIAVEYLNPLMSQARADYTARMKQRKLKIEALDEQAQNQVRGWMNQAQSDLASTKYAAMAYGERMRDASLLNYSRRYGFDNFLGMAAPYQFWYTRSMWNWAKRMVDRPAWFAMYARIQRMQEKMEREGMPSRLKGKVRIPMPFMPSWAGGGIWTDPMNKLLPFAQFGQPLERFNQDKAQIERRAESLLQEMVENEQITFAEAQQALQTKAGSAWDQAMRAAEAELDKSANPASLVTQMLQPPLWWNVATNLAGGTPEKISTLPVTRLGQSIRTATEGTFAEPLGKLAGGALAWPEEKLRGVAGLNRYGEWGDYYIDRQLANMAADGEISAEEAQIAMIQRNGPAFEAAQKRVEYELMMRTPGAASLQQILRGDAGGAIQSLPTILFPGGLFPTGELALRGLKTIHDQAWKDYKNGDTQALQNFFNKYPEYEARMALYDKPEERLRQFLVSQIWDKYTQLERPNKSRMRQTLGDRFEQAFLNPETRSYDSIPVEELALWARMLHGRLPQTKETAPIQELDQMGMIPEADLWPPELAAGIEAYQAERDQRFPGYYAIQSGYYSLPEGAQRKAYLNRFPMLRDYWDWKKEYEQSHPELAPYFEANREKARVSPQEMQQVSANPTLMRELMTYSLTGQPLTPGAQAMLMRISKLSDRHLQPQEYAEMVIEEITAGQ